MTDSGSKLNTNNITVAADSLLTTLNREKAMGKWRADTLEMNEKIGKCTPIFTRFFRVVFASLSSSFLPMNPAHLLKYQNTGIVPVLVLSCPGIVSLGIVNRSILTNPINVFG